MLRPGLFRLADEADREEERPPVDRDFGFGFDFDLAGFELDLDFDAGFVDVDFLFVVVELPFRDFAEPLELFELEPEPLLVDFVLVCAMRCLS